MGPAATEIERQCLRWIAGFVGYPQDTGGILVSGGTMANFTAILTALRHMAPYDSTPEGLQDRARQRPLPPVHGRSRRARLGDPCGRHAESGPQRGAPRPEPAGLHDRSAGARPHAGRGPPSRRPAVLRRRAARIGQRRRDRPDRRARRRLRPPRRLAARRRSLRPAGGGPRGERARCSAAWSAPTRCPSTRTSGSAFPTTAASCWSATASGCAARSRSPRRTSARSADAGDALDYLDYGPQMSRGFRALKVWMVLRSWAPAGCGKGSRGASASRAICTGS